jgi:pyridoxal phosphate enzyme (YggS family)
MSLTSSSAAILSRVAAACAHARRSPSDVELIWVSKTHPVETIVEANDIGARLFGENRVQEILEKFPLPAKPDGSARDYELHLIGSLQRNKVRKVLPLVAAVHSVDSLELWETLNRIDGELGANDHLPLRRRLRVFIQVNTSGEQNKSGVEPGALLDFLAALPPAQNLDLVGLMTMGPVDGGAEAARPCFRQLAELLQAARERFGDRYPLLAKLSMGMSGDFEVAVEEGAHYVRIGSALFGSALFGSR